MKINCTGHVLPKCASSFLLPAKPVGLCVACAFHSAHLHGSDEERASNKLLRPIRIGDTQQPSPSLSLTFVRWIQVVALGVSRKLLCFRPASWPFTFCYRKEITLFTEHRWFLCSSEDNMSTWWIIHFIETIKCQVRKAKTSSTRSTNSYKLQGFFFSWLLLLWSWTLCALEKVYYVTKALKAAAFL